MKLSPDRIEALKKWATDEEIDCSEDGMPSTAENFFDVVALLTELLSLREQAGKLRKIISECAEALANGAFISPEASVEFMAGLPTEIGLVTASLREQVGTLSAERDEARAEATAWANKSLEAVGSLRTERDEAQETIGRGIMRLPAGGRGGGLLDGISDLRRRAEAAESELASLREHNERQGEALKPFADLADDYIEHGMDHDRSAMAGRIKMAQPVGPYVTFADFRRAREVYRFDGAVEVPSVTSDSAALTLSEGSSNG